MIILLLFNSELFHSITNTWTMENESNCKESDTGVIVSCPSTARSSNSNSSGHHSRSISGSQHVYLSLTPTETNQEVSVSFHYK